VALVRPAPLKQVRYVHYCTAIVVPPKSGESSPVKEALLCVLLAQTSILLSGTVQLLAERPEHQRRAPLQGLWCGLVHTRAACTRRTLNKDHWQEKILEIVKYNRIQLTSASVKQKK